MDFKQKLRIMLKNWWKQVMKISIQGNKIDIVILTNWFDHWIVEPRKLLRIIKDYWICTRIPSIWVPLSRQKIGNCTRNSRQVWLTEQLNAANVHLMPLSDGGELKYHLATSSDRTNYIILHEQVFPLPLINSSSDPPVSLQLYSVI